MEIRLLGVVEVLDDEHRATVVRGRHLRSLLIALALRCGESVSSDRLVETLWDTDLPTDSANALQRHVSALRRVLGDPELVQRRGPGYLLALEPAAVDALDFERLARQGRAAMTNGDFAAARSLLSDALGLWNVADDADLTAIGFTHADAARFTEERLSAIEAGVEAELALGRGSEVVAELESLVARHPFREHLVGQLMLALAADGRQAEALRAFQTARAVLVEELGLEPSEHLRKIETAILVQDPSLTPDAPRQSRWRRTNLRTPITSLIGRHEELQVLGSMLATQRLVTLVGAGGAGKTRLAIEVAHRWLESTEADVWLVELAGLDGGEGVEPAIAAALELPGDAGFGPAVGGRQGITEHLSTLLTDRPMLLLLDNCEHLLVDVARVAQALLESFPSLRVIATSREGLGVTGEVLWKVPPLPLEDAMALFTERATAVAPRLEPKLLADGASGRTLADICRRLDGLPLAIELAAARLTAMPIHELAARLDDRFRLLTHGPRTALPQQRTLRAVVDWSYELLGDDEQRIFERLSVFSGGFAADSAGMVCSDEELLFDDVVEMLTRLADKSLIHMEDRGGRLRYQMLQTLVEYGRERLASSDDADRTRAAHVRHFAQLCERGHAALRGNEQRRWLEDVGMNLENIRSALDAAIAICDAQTAQAIAGSLGWYWWVSGQATEGYRWLSAARACRGASEAVTRARVLAWAAYLGTRPAARAEEGVTADDTDPLLDEAIALYREAGAYDELATIEAIMAMMYSTRGARDRMRELVSDAERLLADAQPTPWNVAIGRWLAARRAFYEGRYDDAQAAVVASNELLAIAGDEFLAGFNAMYLGRIAVMRGDYGAAIHALERGIVLADALGLSGLANTLTTDLGDAVALSGNVERAHSILDTALTTGRDIVFLPGTGQALTALAWLERRAGNHNEAAALADDALAVAVAADNRIGIMQCLVLLGHLAEEVGNVTEARTRHQQALESAIETGDPRARALALEGFASLALKEGDAAATARLLGIAQSSLRAMTWATGWPLASSLIGDTRRITDAASEQLGAEAFAMRFDQGLAEGAVPST